MNSQIKYLLWNFGILDKFNPRLGLEETYSKISKNVYITCGRFDITSNVLISEYFMIAKVRISRPNTVLIRQ